MRRTLAIVVLGGALLGAASCGPKTTDTAAAPSASASQTGGSTKTICDSIEPAFLAWATELGALPALTSKSTSADIAAYFDKWHEATDKVIAALNAAGSEATDPAFKQTIATLEKLLKDGNTAFTVEAAAKGAKNPFVGADFSNAASAIYKACTAAS
jgi:hypothetical protein